MRVALLSDVHANLVALEAVLSEAGAVDAIWVMGDTVGYGPDPADVIALLRERGAVMVAGNHDLAVATGQGLDVFNAVARDAAMTHREWLSAADRDFLGGLPQIGHPDGVTLVHGSLRDPVWEYVWDSRSALASLVLAESELSCNGHTHVPAVFELDGQHVRGTLGRGTVALRGRALVNPGSVGQPRDRDPRSAWAILDTEGRTVEFMRTAYDVAETQRRIRDRGLPAFLADRLASGV
ncbi:MAG TPA: metallophosphoesterase family protein [Candidatus Limnocylindria bacterium]|nr:metallophosphoesterase family protein [Candidatus Limnocylindria bacterium]